MAGKGKKKVSERAANLARHGVLETAATDQPNRMLLAGRLLKRANGMVQIDLTDGLVIDVSEDDCKLIEETTDPVSKRAIVALELNGDKPITATFQPHFYRVLATSKAIPYVFRGTHGIEPRQLSHALARAISVGGGGGGADHTTNMMTSTWFGTENDGQKPDDASEPGDIYL
jgi:hypothetical protein